MKAAGDEPSLAIEYKGPTDAIKDVQILEGHSISAGLDYPGVGPEHAHLKESGRAEYVGVTDQEALDAFMLLSKLEGIIPALETGHALAALEQVNCNEKGRVVICLSGRGDKDMGTFMRELGKVKIEK